MAGVNVGTAYLEIIPSAKGFAGKLQGEVGTGMASAGKRGGKEYGSSFSASFKGAAAGAVAALGLKEITGKVIDFAKDSVGEARESQKVGALTANVIKSTGGAAKVTAGQVGDLATAISNKTGIDDEAIQSASNLLLTFTNVRNEVGKGNDVFNQATQAATDMGAALGGDPKSSAIQLGKALNDPVKGVTALQRVGVSFTAQQKEQIKTMVKNKDTLGAQKLILGELNKEFGGAAAASATAGEKMKTAWANFKENIGTAALPMIDKLEGFITNRLLPGVQGLFDLLVGGKFTKAFREAFHVEEDSGVVDFLFKVRDGFKDAIGYAKDFAAGLTLKDAGDIGAPLDGFVAKGKAVRDIALKIWDAAKQLWPSIKQIGTQFAAASAASGVSTWSLLKDALNALPGILKAIAPVLQSVATWMGENQTTVAALVTALTAGVTAFKVITGVVRAYTAVQTLLNIVLAANPIGIVVVAIAALVGGLIYAYNTSETFRSYVSTAFSVVKIGALELAKVAVTAFQFLANVWLTVVGVLIDGAANAFGWVPGIGPKLQGLQKDFHTFKDSANKSLDGIRDDLQVKVDTEKANIALEALHREFLSKGWTVTAEVNTRMVYGGNGQLVPAHASGGAIGPGLHVVGDNPDGSWNKTTELLGVNGAGHVYNQAQIKVAPAASSGIDYDRLAYAISQIQVKGNISPSSLDHTMGARV